MSSTKRTQIRVTLTHATTDYTTAPTTNWLTAYSSYVNKAGFNRIGWAATALAIQDCLLSPTLSLLMAYVKGGNWQFLASMLCFLLVLVPILAAMPVNYIFPAFATSFVIHLAIILPDIL